MDKLELENQLEDLFTKILILIINNPELRKKDIVRICNKNGFDIKL